VLERVIVSLRPQRAVGKPEMHPHRRIRIAPAKRKGLAALQRAQPLEAVAVPMCRDDCAFLGQDCVGLFRAPERTQNLSLTKPRIGPDWPIGRVHGLPKRSQSPSRLAARHQHSRPLQRQLASEVRQSSLQEEVDLGAEPACNYPQHSRRRLAPTQLDLVEERAAEIPAADLGQAHASLLAQAANALAEGFLAGHARSLLDVKPGFTVPAPSPRGTALGEAAGPDTRCNRPSEEKPHAGALPAPLHS